MSGNFLRYFKLPKSLGRAVVSEHVNASSCALCTVRPNNLKHRSLEQRKDHARWWGGTCLYNPQVPWRVSAKHFQKPDKGEGVRGYVIRSYCCCSVSKSRLTLWDPWIEAHQASLSFIISWNLLKLVSIESVMPSNHFILCQPLLLLPSIFPCIRVFSNESVLHIRWPKYWSFSFSISLSSKYSWLISFRIDWFDLLPVQGTLKSLLQHHSSKASILHYSAFLRSNSHNHAWLMEKP